MILAVFSDVYLGAGLFRLEPAGFNMGSGWWISPVTILMPVMLLFSLKVKLKKNPADIFLLLFFVWSALTFTFNTDQNSFYGMIALSESVLLYFLFRLYLKKEDQPFLTALFLAILLFQTFIGLWQFYLGRPIGLIAESIIADNPAGITTSENIRLFRISGTFGHPNVLAAFLLVLYPFLDLFKSIKSWANTFRSMVILAFIFTFSRLAWVVLLIVHLIFSYSLPYSIAIDRFRKKFHLNRKAVIYLSTVLIIIYLLFPYILLRFKTIPARKKHEEEVDREVTKWTSQLTAEEIFEKLQKNGVKAGIVQTLADLFADPQLKHRGVWAAVDHPEIGRCHTEGPPFAFSKTPFKIDRPAPMIGEHNELVFEKFLAAGKKAKN